MASEKQALREGKPWPTKNKHVGHVGVLRLYKV